MQNLARSATFATKTITLEWILDENLFSQTFLGLNTGTVLLFICVLLDITYRATRSDQDKMWGHSS